MSEHAIREYLKTIKTEGGGRMNPKIDLASYGTSPTSESTITKVVTTNGGNFERVNGAYVVVTFTNANTGSVSLNVDGTGSKYAYYNGSRLNASNGNFSAGETVTFMYDGTYYQRLDTDTDDTSILKSLANLGWSDVLSNGLLIVKKLLAKLLKCDCVIENGTYVGANGELHYKKWAHGTLEISVYLYGFNLTNYAAGNGWYFYYYTLNWNNITPITIPNFINTQYAVTHSWVIGDGVASPSTVLNKATNQLTLYGMGGASGSQPIQISVELKGRWK